MANSKKNDTGKQYGLNIFVNVYRARIPFSGAPNNDVITRHVLLKMSRAIY